MDSRLSLNDGNQIPALGLGVYLAEASGEAEQACLWALKHGYRHIDTAEDYGYCISREGGRDIRTTTILITLVQE